MVARGKCPRE